MAGQAAHVGLGGNLGEVRGTFAQAVRAMRALPGVATVRRSSLWDSTPVGPVADQPRFLNACVALWFEAGRGPAPGELLASLLDIERALGRDRAGERPQGPRSIDLDLLLWGGLVLDDPGPPRLVLPHPGLARRAFALAPLVELAGPDLVIPGGGGGRAGELLAAALADPSQRVRRR